MFVANHPFLYRFRVREKMRKAMSYVQCSYLNLVIQFNIPVGLLNNQRQAKPI